MRQILKAGTIVKFHGCPIELMAATEVETPVDLGSQDAANCSSLGDGVIHYEEFESPVIQTSGPLRMTLRSTLEYEENKT